MYIFFVHKGVHAPHMGWGPQKYELHPMWEAWTPWCSKFIYIKQSHFFLIAAWCKMGTPVWKVCEKQVKENGYNPQQWLKSHFKSWRKFSQTALYCYNYNYKSTEASLDMDHVFSPIYTTYGVDRKDIK